MRDVEEARVYTTTELRELGFKVLDSRTNFIFLEHPYLSGEEYVRELRERGILVRRYPSRKRAENYVRITIGTLEEMQAVVAATRSILLCLAA